MDIHMENIHVVDGEHRRNALLALASRTGQAKPCAHDEYQPCNCGDHPPPYQHYRGREIRARAS